MSIAATAAAFAAAAVGKEKAISSNLIRYLLSLSLSLLLSSSSYSNIQLTNFP